jgi:hypothetical protein
MPNCAVLTRIAHLETPTAHLDNETVKAFAFPAILIHKIETGLEVALSSPDRSFP